MATFTANLRDAGATKPTPLNLYIHFGKDSRLKRSLRIRVHPKNWQPDRSKPNYQMIVPDTGNNHSLNLRLKAFIIKISRLFDKFKMIEEREPTVKEAAALWNLAVSKKSRNLSFAEQVRTVTNAKSKRVITPKNGTSPKSKKPQTISHKAPQQINPKANHPLSFIPTFNAEYQSKAKRMEKDEEDGALTIKGRFNSIQSRLGLVFRCTHAGDLAGAFMDWKIELHTIVNQLKSSINIEKHTPTLLKACGTLSATLNHKYNTLNPNLIYEKNRDFERMENVRRTVWEFDSYIHSAFKLPFDYKIKIYRKADIIKQFQDHHARKTSPSNIFTPTHTFKYWSDAQMKQVIATYIWFKKKGIISARVLPSEFKRMFKYELLDANRIDLELTKLELKILLLHYKIPHQTNKTQLMSQIDRFKIAAKCFTLHGKKFTAKQLEKVNRKSGGDLSNLDDFLNPLKNS